MDLFDDGLSEDWISQPRSSDGSATQDDTSILRQSISSSRIPLPKSHSLSSLPRRFSGHVLAERTKSALNVEKNAPSSRQQARKSSQVAADTSVDEDYGSVRLGTVQHKEQEGSGGARQGTPEWKRRLLNGKDAASKQQDLFSPMGLEKVFRPPTVRKENGVQLRRTKTMPPSSAPPSNVPPSSVPPSSVPPSSPPMLPNRVAPSIASDSLNESIQLPRLPPMPRSYSNLRKVSRAASRMSSGKSCLQHESFSPVQLPPTDTESIPEKPLNGTSIHDWQNQRDEERSRPASSMSDSALNMLDPHQAMEEPQVDADCTSVSLPDNLNHESETYAFVTMRRGGFSSEGSFQRKPLSPSSFQPQSTPTLQTTVRQLQAAGPAPQTPHARNRARRGGDGSQENPRSSGSPHKLSPLKLFDKYDTFTNDRLNRRISQFEASGDDLANGNDLFEDQLKSTPSPIRKQSTAAEHSKPPQGRKKRISSFGDGMLDQYNFTHTEQKPDILKWQRNAETAIQSDSALPYTMEQSTKRTVFRSVESHSQWNHRTINREEPEVLYEDEESQLLPEGKRLRSSPQKIPNAKRRRTINEQTEELSDIRIQKHRPSLSQNNSMAGKKRKDARYDSSSQIADPETIATRPMLRPKARQQSDSGTVRQTSVARTAETEGEAGEELIDLEKATGVLAGELANLALNVAEGISQGARKKSVTTADFFREANLIMHNLRSNAIKRDDASELSPSHNGQLMGIEESVADMFSTDNFSRPPSREGSPARRKVPGPKDFRVISRLRKFEDTDDIGLALNSSFQGLPRKDGREGTPDSAHSEPSNIRILDPPRNRKHADDPKAAIDRNLGEKGLETAAYPSSKSSSNRSVQTGSSGTRTKAVIPPDRVAHLISSNMGRMTFDEQKGCWVKRKASEEQRAAGDRLESEATEDDPLREIPDLDVDESQEMRTVATGITSRPPSNELPNKHPQIEEEQPPQKESQDDKSTAGHADNSQITKQSRVNSSGPTLETTATSWGTLKRSSRGLDPVSGPEAVKHETTKVQVNVKSKSKQARVVTVAFSSPLVQPIPLNSGERWDEFSDLEIGADSKIGKVVDAPKNDVRYKSGIEARPMKTTHTKVNFPAKRGSVSPALPKIDENEKASSPAYSANASDANLAVALATPQAAIRRADGALSAPSAAKSYVALQLTPLSDFTVHHVDESLNLDVQYIAKRRGLASLHEIEGKFSLSIKDLVEKIADVEPYEPYWEQMRTLHLQDRGLLTLHMLDEFCSRVEELDVSSNELGQLNGAPQTLRVLLAQSNCLSSLTAWGHLCNIQYLDVSNNEIDSLAGFRELIHLRELRAENNQIPSLEAILHLNGLLKLRLGNNAIQNLDFHGADL